MVVVSRRGWDTYDKVRVVQGRFTRPSARQQRRLQLVGKSGEGGNRDAIAHGGGGTELNKVECMVEGLETKG